jgi:hypothetical protein
MGAVYEWGSIDHRLSAKAGVVAKVFGLLDAKSLVLSIQNSAEQPELVGIPYPAGQ